MAWDVLILGERYEWSLAMSIVVVTVEETNISMHE